MHNHTIFLDRDGVINELLPGQYVVEWKEFQFRSGVLDGLAKLHKLKFKMYIITNQQGIGKKIMSDADLFTIHQEMLLKIEQAGGHLNGIYHCPHLESDDCSCRKPKKGMIESIGADHPEIFSTKWILLGDSVADLQLGNSIGAKTFGMRHQHNTLVDWSVYQHQEVHRFEDFVQLISS